jgi:hypothetical protein
VFLQFSQTASQGDGQMGAPQYASQDQMGAPQYASQDLLQQVYASEQVPHPHRILACMSIHEYI